MHTLAPGARGPFKRRRGKNISSLSNSKRVEKDHAIQFHTHLLHHRRGGNLRRVTSLERGGDRGGSSRRTQTHLLGDRLESSGSSYRRHFLFSCCCLYSDDDVSFGIFAVVCQICLSISFIHFCCPNKQTTKSFVGLSTLFFTFPHHTFVRRKVLKGMMEEESLGPPSPPPPPPPPASSSGKEEARDGTTTTVRVVSVCVREEEEEEEEVENGDDVDDAGEEDVNNENKNNEDDKSEKNWLEKAKDGWRAMREKKREKREEIEKMIADVSGSGAKEEEEEEEEEDEDEDEKENDSMMVSMMNAENNSNSNKKSSNKKRVKLRTQTAAYKVTRKIRSATERIRMIGSLCEKWERRLLSVVVGAGDEESENDDAGNKTVELEELEDLCVSLVSILNESVGKLRAYVKESREKVLPNGSVGKKEDELEKVEQKEAKEQLREKAGFKIIARCLERSETLEKRVIQSMAKLNAKNKELVRVRGDDSRIPSSEIKSKAALVVDAFTLYLKSEEQHLKNENERAARLKREQTVATKKKENKTKEDPTPVNLSSLDASTEVFKCLKCDLAFQSFASRNTHMEVKHFDGAKMFFCNKCDGTYTSRTSLHRHVNKHHSQKWACRSCNPIRCFKSRYDLRKHEESKHYEEMKKRRRELGEEEEEEEGDDDTTPKKSSKDMKTAKKSKKETLDETFYTFVNGFFLESSDEDEDE